MIEVQHWGVIDYNEAWERQQKIVKDIQSGKQNNVFVLCQHPSVITIGKSGSEDNVIENNQFLDKLGIKVIKNDRGGDVTLHNPGQLVGYPLFNLGDYKKDLHWFLREIEAAIIELLNQFDIKADIVPGLTGVWIENQRKICAIGLHCSSWVTSHGFALNVCNNLDEFNYIIPCGISNKQVTSISMEIGTDIEISMIENECSRIFEKKF